ncbi:hypothetical protein ACQF36_29305 [Streptomyces sp. Marseille-Q5077]|uniref:hypothetical protein n=1 Tax=Streptomyces sp. Marseille-Q5077 TaxID=3418995 RepID=UPI003CFE70D7
MPWQVVVILGLLEDVCCLAVIPKSLGELFHVLQGVAAVMQGQGLAVLVVRLAETGDGFPVQGDGFLDLPAFP